MQRSIARLVDRNGKIVRFQLVEDGLPGPTFTMEQIEDLALQQIERNLNPPNNIVVADPVAMRLDEGLDY